MSGSRAADSYVKVGFLGNTAVCTMFLASYYLNPLSIIFSISRVVTGFLAILVLPGVFLSISVMNRKWRNLGTTLLLGLTNFLVWVQVGFLIRIVLGAVVPLLVWTVCANAFSFAIFIIRYYSWREDCKLDYLEIRETLVVEFPKILTIALLLRVILVLIAQDAISPDASLYADYASGIIEGQFSTMVMGDGSVHEIIPDVQYLTHQATTYIFALSWLMIDPPVAGPVLSLVLVGCLLIFPCYEIASRCFGSTAAKRIAAIIAIHPLFIFHSSIGYGPTLTSSLFLIYAALFILGGYDQSSSSTPWVLTGLILGFVDVIWYPGFYAACITLPIAYLYVKRKHQNDSLKYLSPIIIALAARLIYSNTLIFYGVWAVLFSLFYLIKKEGKHPKLRREFYLFAGVLFVIALWRLPIQIRVLIDGSATNIPQSLLSVVASAPSLISKVPNILIFILFHVTPILLLLIPFGIIRGSNRDSTSIFAFIGCLLLAEVILSLGVITESLQLIYFFSDSRFFLLPVLMLILSLGSIMSHPEKVPILGANLGFLKDSVDRRTLFILALVSIGFIPSYLAYPSGISLIDIEERYGWHDLSENVQSLGNENTIFLADRAREFAWYTNRRSATLVLDMRGLDYLNSSRQILSLASYYGAEYLLVDGYTVTKWNTSQFLLIDPIIQNSLVILDVQGALQYYESSVAYNIESLEMVYETEPNHLGRYSRIFRFTYADYAPLFTSSLIDSRWAASNGGTYENINGTARVSIGEGKDTTTTFWNGSSNFVAGNKTGFMILNIQEIDAVVDAVEIYNDRGELIRTLERVNENYYVSPVGDIKIGDIRVIVSGSQGNSVMLHSLEFWSAV
jgi:hypothetical protein